MSALDERVAAILADPLAEARAAERAIGHVGVEMPDDLLAASGRFVFHLPWNADRETPTADLWLESAFPGAARSIVEDWAAGRFDFAEAVLFTRGEDSSQRLYYYISELQRTGRLGGPEALIFDVAKVPRQSSLDRTFDAVKALAARLGVDEAALESGIDTVNRRRELLARLRDSRRGPGSRYERIARASLFADLDGAVPDATGEDAAGPRLMLAGSAPPDDRIHLAIEQAGANVVSELYDRSLARLGDVLDGGADPFAAIARRTHETRLGPRSFADRAAWTLAEARAAGADAVVVWLVAEDEASVWHVPAQRCALADAGIPALFLTNRRWDGSDGAADEIAAFIGELAR